MKAEQRHFRLRRHGRGLREGTARSLGSARKALFWILALGALAGWPGADPILAAGESHFGPDVSIPMRFQWDDPAGEAVAARCREALMRHGLALRTAVLPAGATLRPVLCMILTTESFKQQFAQHMPDWGIGVALPGGSIVAVDWQRCPEVGRGAEEVFLHELTHALIFQGTEQAWVPAWFHEGVAMWLSGEWRFVDTVSVMLNGHLPQLIDLQGRFPAQASWADQAYRTSLLAIESLRKEHGEGVIAQLVAATARTGDFDAAFVAVTGESPEGFSERFGGAMRLRFGWLVTLTRWPSLFVLMALIFAVGAAFRMIRNKRRLAAMPDEPEGWPHQT